MSSNCYLPMTPQDKSYFIAGLQDLAARIYQLEILRLPYITEKLTLVAATLVGNELTFTYSDGVVVNFTLPQQDISALVAASHTHANKEILDQITAPFTTELSANLASALLALEGKVDSIELQNYVVITDPRLSDARPPLAHTHELEDIEGLPPDFSDFVVTSDLRLSNAREWIAATVTKIDAEAGTSTDRFAWTPERIKEAILALAPSGGGGGGIPEAPMDGQQYARKNGAWAVVVGGGGGSEDTSGWGELAFRARI